ncbi:MAG: ribosomal protein S18-alanine N-acetyltransferase [Desulfurococcaceae archaeon]
MKTGSCRDVFVKDFDLSYMNEIVEIESECFNSSVRYSEEVFNYYYQRGSIFKVAECGGVIAGYVIADIEDSLCHVVSIAVRRMYRRMGIGSTLLDRALAECKGLGARRAYLEVATSNQPALEMYLKAGFQVIGVIKGYYGVEDAYVMVKELDQRG